MTKKHRALKHHCPVCNRIIHKVCPLAPHILLSSGKILRPIKRWESLQRLAQ